MDKKKYVKPIVEDLTGFNCAKGSCWSGSGEKDLEGCQVGALAVSPCTTGSIVYPRVVCQNGGFAGMSCFSGSDAG